MSAGPAWEDSHLDLQDDDIVLDNPYESWKNVTRTTRTVTTSIKGIQQTLDKERLQPLTKRTLLMHQTEIY